jgi:hypothetical protein
MNKWCPRLYEKANILANSPPIANRCQDVEQRPRRRCLVKISELEVEIFPSNENTLREIMYGVE